MSNGLVSAYELSRVIAKQIDQSFGPSVENQGFMQKTVMKVLTTFGKFVSHHFKKEGQGLFIADVPIIGQFLCYKDGGKPQFDFIPSTQMQVDCMMSKKSQLLWEGVNMQEANKRDLGVGKVAEVCQLGFDQAQQILTLIVKQIAAQIKVGRQIAIDLFLPNDIYFFISQNGCEFHNKNGISDMITEQLSQSKGSQFTDTSSIMQRENGELLALPKKKRTLSIMNSSPQRMMLSPPKQRKINYDDYNNFNTVDRPRGGQLNQENLKSLAGSQSQVQQELQEYAQSLKSGVFSAHKRKANDKESNLNRFPSIASASKHGRFEHEIVSHKSRLSSLSKAASQQSGFNRQPASTRASSAAKMDFAQVPADIFMSPSVTGDRMNQKQRELREVQEDLLSNIIAKRRQKEQERVENLQFAQDAVSKDNQQHYEHKLKTLQSKKAQQQSLKEKLIASKQQRQEQDGLDRQERLRKMPTYFPYSKQPNNKRTTQNRFDDYVSRRTERTEMSEVGDQEPEALEGDDRLSTVGKFTDPKASYKIDDHNKITYQLLERDLKGTEIRFQAEERVGHHLERVRQAKIIERMEFEKQIEDFNQKELLKILQKKEMLNANKDYWKQQIKWNEARRVQSKVIELNAGNQPTFLKKMFKYQEQLDIKKDETITDTLPVHETPTSRQQRSRMFANMTEVKDEIANQIEATNIKKKVEKMQDLEIGIEMAEAAEENARQEYEFMTLKQERAQTLMKQQWDEQLKLRQNEQLVDRIFQ